MSQLTWLAANRRQHVLSQRSLFRTALAGSLMKYVTRSSSQYSHTSGSAKAASPLSQPFACKKKGGYVPLGMVCSYSEPADDHEQQNT
jgi:hypothetical protein